MQLVTLLHHFYLFFTLSVFLNSSTFLLTSLVILLILLSPDLHRLSFPKLTTPILPSLIIPQSSLPALFRLTAAVLALLNSSATSNPLTQIFSQVICFLLASIPIQLAPSTHMSCNFHRRFPNFLINTHHCELFPAL